MSYESAIVDGHHRAKCEKSSSHKSANCDRGRKLLLLQISAFRLHYYLSHNDNDNTNNNNCCSSTTIMCVHHGASCFASSAIVIDGALIVD